MLRLLYVATVALGALAVVGTLFSLTKCQHWATRLWDFPRVQIAASAAASAAVFRAKFFRGRRFDWAFLAATLLTLCWQARKILPYTLLAPVKVQRSRHNGRDARSLRVMMANVMMENRQHHRLLGLVQQRDPDVLLVVETGAEWARALEPLKAAYTHCALQPQENYYGLLLFSRFPLHETRIEFIVQDDIPSVHTAVELPSGDRVFLHGLHPRPPEPLRDQDSTPRDAELVLVGRAIREKGIRPTIVAGDLNDVAWSRTSELFLRLSGLLDPRIGRGFYNSFHVDHLLIRYPLDHVFHSHHFRLVRLERLPPIGSDHFPMLIELRLEDDAPQEQPSEEEDEDDREEAAEKVENQAEEARGR